MDLLDTFFGQEETEAQERRKVRRAFAQIACAQVFLITVVFLLAMFSDSMSARAEKAWPPFAVMFPSLLVYLMHYTHVGNKETQMLMQTKQAAAPTVAAAKAPPKQNLPAD